MNTMITALSSRMDRLMRGFRAAEEDRDYARMGAIREAYRGLDLKLRATWDYVTVWTLTIDDDEGVSTTVHANEEQALEALREYLTEHNDPEDVPTVDDGEALLEYACEEGGIALYLDEHRVTGARTVKS